MQAVAVLEAARAVWEAVLERCCGLDVHKKTVTACLLIGALDQQPRELLRTFPTMTKGLLDLRDWLEENGCTHVAIESTGVYWRPVFHILEDAVTVLLVNAYHMKQIPGRKTDLKDAQWIARLLRWGLLKPSLIPPRPIRELRDLCRYRKKLTEQASAEKNRIQKVLEDANIKVASVASDMFGVSGRAMLDALLAGDMSSEEMAEGYRIWLDQISTSYGSAPRRSLIHPEGEIPSSPRPSQPARIESCVVGGNEHREA